MAVDYDTREAPPRDYPGRILNGDYSPSLKKRVSECIDRFRAFDETGSPGIPYISAWREGDSFIWYEFVGRRLLRLLGSPASKAADVLRDSVVERRVYKNPELDEEIKKESMHGPELDGSRERLREEDKTAGQVDAVYKISLDGPGEVWVKDQASVEAIEADRINLSLGCLTIVSKEMELEDKCEKLIAELKKSMAEVKTLSGLLPICASCKKIRDDKGYWNQIEDYLWSKSRVEFSHGICPDCALELYPELYTSREDAEFSVVESGDKNEEFDAFLKKL
ncbi:MAG: hypothetical protein GY859_02850 [Desulfobacterales bacterium]|nr:hypothetical protein [Desulfobacterales bacterium]